MNKIYFTLLLAMLSSFVYSQNSLTGTVTDVNNNLPLEQVSIYFPQLEKGAITDARGVYKISNLPSGSYKIVVSYIGYQTVSKSISTKVPLKWKKLLFLLLFTNYKVKMS